MTTPTAHALPARRMSLAVRIFLLVAGLLVAAVGAAVLLSLRLGSEIAAGAVSHALQSSSAVQAEFSAQRLSEVELKAQLIAADAAFVNYVAAAQSGASGIDAAELAETASIYDLLRERQDAYGFDLGIVLDPQGAVLARSDQPEAYAQDLAEDAFVASVIEDLRPVSGYWRMGPQVYQAALLPLAQGEDLAGFLLVARAIDRAYSQQIRRVSDADVAFLLPAADGRIALAGSSLPSREAADLQAALARADDPIAGAVRAGSALEQSALQLGEQRWSAQLQPLDANGGAAVGSVLRLISAQQTEAGYRQILNRVAVAGVLALLVALPLSFLLAKRSLRPLREMARIAKNAVAGDYRSTIAVGGKDELGELSRAFDSLMSDLRGERDIESYVTHLSRLLPEPGDDAPAHPTQVASPPPATARRERCLLLGIDTRERLQPRADERAEAVAARVGEFTEALAGLAGEYGGRPLAATGSRYVLGFAGAEAQSSALNCASELLQAEPGLALAMIEGEVVSTGTAVVGVPAQQCERLLGEAGPGQLLLPKPLGEALRARLGEASVQVLRGAASGKPYYAASASTLAAARPAQPRRAAAADPMTTRVHAAPGTATTAAPPTDGFGPGTRLGDRFRILAVLGSGGMGVVYKARDLELDDVVALKMLKGDAIRDPEQLDRLKSEIRLARRITHPNVLRTFDFGDIDGRPFITMEYVRGMTLRYLLEQSGRIPFAAALRIARQLCAGLQAAHEVGVLHRDIKPENLILEASGNAKLMDFGIARPIRRSGPGSTEPGMYLGTPAYSAPEQLAGLDVDHRADIFATGVLLSELFCGQLPFAGRSTVEIYLAQQQGELRAPRSAWPDIAPALEALILRCIELDPARRFPSAAALAEALGGIRS